jgi:hypothetical protein
MVEVEDKEFEEAQIFANDLAGRINEAQLPPWSVTWALCDVMTYIMAKDGMPIESCFGLIKDQYESHLENLREDTSVH